MVQLPESLPALQMPRMASRAAVKNSSTIDVSRASGKSAVQLPVNSCFCPSIVARHVPRKTVLSRPSPKVQVPDALSVEEAGSTVQLPSKVRPVVLRALQLERCDCSLKACFSWPPGETSIARTQPTKPWDVLTIYHVSCPTASARGVSS